MIQSRKSILLLMLLGAAIAPSFAGSPDLLKMSADQMRTSGIAVERVSTPSTKGGAGDGLRLSGSVVFPVKATQVISAPAAGVVQAMLTDPMERVAAGAPIVRLHSPQLLEWQRSYVQSSVQARLAAEKYKRDEALFKEGIIPESRFQETHGMLVQSSVAEQEQRQALRIAGMGDKAIGLLASAHSISPVLTVVAPAAGTVIEQMVTPGQRVEAGAPLAKVAQSGKLWIELQAARQQAGLIGVGDAVSVTGCTQAGRITAVGMQLDSATQTVIVRAELPSAETCLRPNQYVEASVKPRRVQDGMLELPVAALVRFEGKDYVFTRADGGFLPAAVTVVSRGAERAMVQGPLKSGTEVAVRGVSTLKGMWQGLGNGSGEGQ